MTKHAGLARATVCAALLLSICAVAGPARALDVTPRYASPAGSGSDCLKESPCDIVEAINNSPSDREVIIEPGVYGSAGSPITTTLNDSGSSDLDVHGVAGAPNPVVYSSASPAAILFTTGTSLSHLTLVVSGSTQALVLAGVGDHLAVVATESSSIACSIIGELIDSLCLDTGSHGAAYDLETSNDANASLDNDTLIATNGSAILLDVITDVSPGPHVHIEATDTIARGSQFDVSATAQTASTAEVDMSHSAYRPDHTRSTAGTASIVNEGGNTAASPKFVAANSGDFREAAGSPTIDKGLRALNNDTDLAGNPRTLGKTTDMGAYEFLPKPHVSKLHVAHKATHSLTVTVPVNPEGLATSVRLIARRGHRQKTSHRALAGDGRTKTSIHLKVKGLHAGTKYQLVAKATNDAGTASRSKTVKTKPKHKHHHHPRT